MKFLSPLFACALLCAALACGADEPHALAVRHRLCWPEDRGLVINEWLANPEGPDPGREWLELGNVGSEPICLNRAVLTVEGAAHQQSRTLLGLPCLAPHAWLLLGDGTADSRARAGGLPVDTHLGGLELPNTGARIRIACRGETMAEVAYGDDGAAPAPVATAAPAPLSGRSTARVQAADGSPQFCNVRAPPYDGRDAGSPGAANPGCRQCAGDDGSLRDQRLPRAGQLAVRAVYADPPGADRDREWLWLRNDAADAIDLAGLAVTATVPSRRPRLLILESASCTPLAAGATLGLPVLALPRPAEMPALRGRTLPNAAALYRLAVDEHELAAQWVDAPERHACVLP